jgi:hypothetical protein
VCGKLNKVYSGKVRIYFNKHCSRPWCVDTLESDYIQEFEFECLRSSIGLNYVYTPWIKQLPDHSGPPCAYTEGHGELWVNEDLTLGVLRQHMLDS